MPINKISRLLLCALLVACGNGKEKAPVEQERVFPGYHELLDEIVRSPEGIFRGLHLNASSATIIGAEKSRPVDSSDTHLYYEYRPDSATEYSVDYTLNNDSLEEINVQISMRDPELSSYIFCDLKDYYANKLPNPTEDKGYVVYNCFEGQRRPFVVSLSDNSSPNRGIINMVIYKDK